MAHCYTYTWRYPFKSDPKGQQESFFWPETTYQRRSHKSYLSLSEYTILIELENACHSRVIGLLPLQSIPSGLWKFPMIFLQIFVVPENSKCLGETNIVPSESQSLVQSVRVDDKAVHGYGAPVMAIEPNENAENCSVIVRTTENTIDHSSHPVNKLRI